MTLIIYMTNDDYAFINRPKQENLKTKRRTFLNYCVIILNEDQEMDSLQKQTQTLSKTSFRVL